MMTVSRNKLDKSDIRKLGLLSMLEQVCFSFERMQAPGFCWGMIPGFKKIYGDNKEEIAKAMVNNLGFFNTEPHMATFLQGLTLSLEEAGQDREMIKRINAGLFGPLAGVGDAVFWFTMLPISGAISCSLAGQGNPVGPIIFIAIWMFLAFSRIWFASLGYNLGVRAVEMISENVAAITKAAGILGVTVVGGLIPSYISFSLAWAPELPVIGPFSIQENIFDVIFPNILPLGLVFFFYWLFKSKKANAIVLIVGIIVACVVLAFLGSLNDFLVII